MSDRSSSKQTKVKFITRLLLMTGFSLALITAQAQTRPSPTASASPGASSAASLKVQTGSLGSYLVDSQGKSLYIYEADSPNSGTSTCNDACAQVWPPLIVAQGQTAQAQTGVTSNLIGTITRSDGTQQATYNGWPLYYYTQDKNPGDTTGQAITSFGALWYLIQANGNPLTSSNAAGTAAGAGTATGTATGYAAGTAAGTSAACTTSTDTYGNVIYNGNCAGVAGTSAGCTYSTDAYGNVIYSGNCAGTSFPGNNNNPDHDHNHDHDHMEN